MFFELAIHLPNLNLSNDDLLNDNLYETEYINGNINLEKNDLNLEAYQLTSRILNDLGINNGILTKLHQNYLFDIENSIYNDEDAYLNILKSIEYDIFSGKKYLYNYIESLLQQTLNLGQKILFYLIYILKKETKLQKVKTLHIIQFF